MESLPNLTEANFPGLGKTVKMPKTLDTSKPLKVAFKGYSNERGDFYIRLFLKHTRL